MPVNIDTFVVRYRDVNGLVHLYSETWGQLCAHEWMGHRVAVHTCVTCFWCAVRWRR